MPERTNEVKLVKILLDNPLFEGLDYTQISSLLEVCRQRQVPAGEALCEPRTIDDRLLILLEGKLRLESAEGRRFAELVPVRVLGEMGVLTGQTRSSRVVAEEDSTVLELLAEDLQDLVEEDPQMANHMLVSLINLVYTRLHDTNEEVEELRHQVERLRKRLKELSPEDALLSELFPESVDDPLS